MTDLYKVRRSSGEEQVFSTGAHRDSQKGKGRFDLLPMYAMFLIAKHYEAGAVRYGDENWRKGIPLRRYFNSAMRHMAKGMLGMTDEPHFVAACWNLMCLIETKFMIDTGILPKELDDLPKLPDMLAKLDLFTSDIEQLVKDKPEEVFTIDLSHDDMNKKINELRESNPEFKRIFDQMAGKTA